MNDTTSDDKNNNGDDYYDDKGHTSVHFDDEERQRLQDDSRHMNDSTLPPDVIHATTPVSVSSTGRAGRTSHATSAVPTTTTATTSRIRTTTTRNNKKSLFGLADWTRLVKSSKDLAQRKGQDLRRSISKQEVALHKYEYDAWIILHNRVYNIGPYLHYHPGGVSILKPYLGKDATAVFEKYHRWVNADGLIGTLLLGYLDLTPHLTHEETHSYLPYTTTTDSSPSTMMMAEDSFAVPAPRLPPATTSSSSSSSSGGSGSRNTTTKNLLPSLLFAAESMDDEPEEDYGRVG